MNALYMSVNNLLENCGEKTNRCDNTGNKLKLSKKKSRVVNKLNTLWRQAQSATRGTGLSCVLHPPAINHILNSNYIYSKRIYVHEIYYTLKCSSE